MITSVVYNDRHVMAFMINEKVDMRRGERRERGEERKEKAGGKV